MCHQAVAHITSGPVWDIWGKAKRKLRPPRHILVSWVNNENNDDS